MHCPAVSFLVPEERLKARAVRDACWAQQPGNSLYSRLGPFGFGKIISLAYLGDTLGFGLGHVV